MAGHQAKENTENDSKVKLEQPSAPEVDENQHQNLSIAKATSDLQEA